MAGYIIKIEHKYKEWIAKKSVVENQPIYKIFENTLFPYYQDHFTKHKIGKTTLSSDTSQLPLSKDFGKNLRLEAIEKRTNVVSLVDTIFKFYLEQEEGKS